MLHRLIGGHVSESSHIHLPRLIQERMNETHRGHVSVESDGVQQTHHLGKGGGSSRSSVNKNQVAIKEHLKIGTNHSQIRESSAIGVVVRSGGDVISGKVLRDSIFLVGRLVEQNGKSTRRPGNSLFNTIVEGGSSQRHNIRRSRNKIRIEELARIRVRAIADIFTSDSPVTRTSEKCATSHGNESKLKADSPSISCRHSVFIILITH
mmetsp:Transcript_2673/g.4123  ORF Transcript_2673/g.4123 Transcript_2673/m.4123 type:complete len:208 (+) Transcript_2673:212-835(+)